MEAILSNKTKLCEHFWSIQQIWVDIFLLEKETPFCVFATLLFDFSLGFYSFALSW